MLTNAHMYQFGLHFTRCSIFVGCLRRYLGTPTQTLRKDMFRVRVHGLFQIMRGVLFGSEILVCYHLRMILDHFCGVYMPCPESLEKCTHLARNLK